MLASARLLIGALALTVLGVPVGARPAPTRSTPTSVRGLWVLRSSLTSPAAIDAMVEAAREGGMNTLLVQVRGRGEAYYRSAIEPRASDLDGQPDEFDPLATTLERAHAAGLAVHAWVNVNLVASGTTLPRSQDHIVSKHPEWLMVPREIAADLRRIDVRSPAYVGTLARWTRAHAAEVEGLFLSPIPAGSQDYTVRVVEELASRYPLDGIHLDYMRYPSAGFDYSPAALAEFRATKVPDVTLAERQRLDERARVDPAAWARQYPISWTEYRRNRLTSLVERMERAVRAARPTLILSAAVVPDSDDAADRRLQDWAAWARAGYLDAICPMAYSTSAATFATQIAAVRATVGSTPVWAGIGAYRLTVEQTAEHVRIAGRAGAAGVLLFSYDSLTDAAATQPGYLLSLRPYLIEFDPGGRSRH
jgi:uncharacterized lipoprotein YddW (UPF0748 family)